MMLPRKARSTRQRLVVVSNRLPYVLRRGKNRRWSITKGSGGLVTALLPTLRSWGGTWIGWHGRAGRLKNLEDALGRMAMESGFEIGPVSLSHEEVRNFYQGFSNEIVWPLFHDLQFLCNFSPPYWKTYQLVNRRYAQAVARRSRPGDFIWVHDYHLMHVGSELRMLGVTSKIGFFLHVPFPPPDIFVKLPWRLDVLLALLRFDTIGFQTLRDRNNFLQCVRTLLPNVEFGGKGQVVLARTGKRRVRIGCFPIGIDYRLYSAAAGSAEVTREVAKLQRTLPDRQIILGIDRLDYTKGIPQRLEAFRNALLRHPSLHARVTLIQVVVPSREDVPRYRDLKARIEQLVGQINGQFTRPGGWVPIHYVFRGLRQEELLAYYRAAQVALITPLKDGMNLVAKEYCASSIDRNGVLILSEFAGAAAQLGKWALLVNPYDVEGVADTIARAVSMHDRERQRRMHSMRRSIRRHDVFWWADRFLRAAATQD